MTETAFAVIGGLLVVYGVWMIYHPAAAILAGVILLLLARTMMEEEE